MNFKKSLCCKWYQRKYRGHSFVIYLKDLEPSEKRLCVDCGATAEVQVEINIDKRHIISDRRRFLSHSANLIDFTTLLKRRDRSALLGLSQPGQFIEIYLDEIARVTQLAVKAVPDLDFDTEFNHYLETTILHEVLHYYGAQTDDFVHCVLKWLGMISADHPKTKFKNGMKSRIPTLIWRNVWETVI